ncbi:MAG: hypothetical protein R3B82_16435 [Sandaracinaceae bacterium]
MRQLLRLLVITLTLAGCADPVAPADDAGLEADAAMPSDAAMSFDAAVPLDAAMGDAGGSSGAQVFVHLVATHDAVDHLPSTSGQTPRDWVSGIRSLHLMRSETDPTPFLVFSHGDGFVEASYADGADTIVGSRPIAELEPGVYAWARVVHTHVRFTIDATLHAGFGPMPGALEDFIALSDRTTALGRTWSQGDYRTVFTTAGRSFPAEGTGYTWPSVPGGGFTTRVEDGETAFYFPAPLVVDDTLSDDVHLIFTVNVHEGFPLDRSAH